MRARKEARREVPRLTLLDLAAVLLLVAYVALGWYTGTVRRVLGLIVALIALWVATNMGQQGGSIVIQNQPGMSIPDARMISWLFFFLLILLVLEGATYAVRDQLQIAVVAVNRAGGLVAALATFVVINTAVVYMLAGFGQPTARQPDTLQLRVRDAVVNSGFAYPLAKSTANAVLPLLNSFLPRDPKAYFNLEGTGQGSG
ncbi:MAG TPA: CvpA family protein [Candidatus Dormibacteraeota bacterium]